MIPQNGSAWPTKFMAKHGSPLSSWTCAWLSPTPMRGQDTTERKDSSRRVLLAGSSLFKWVFHQSILVHLDKKIIFTLMRQEHFRLSLWEEKLKAPPEPGRRAGRQERVLRVSRWGQCRAAGRGQSRWSSTRCPRAGTPPAPGWTWCGWRAAAASRWYSWCTAARMSSPKHTTPGRPMSIMVHVRGLRAPRSSVLERPYTGHPFHEPALPFQHPERAQAPLKASRGSWGLVRVTYSHVTWF